MLVSSEIFLSYCVGPDNASSVSRVLPQLHCSLHYHKLSAFTSSSGDEPVPGPKHWPLTSGRMISIGGECWWYGGEVVRWWWWSGIVVTPHVDDVVTGVACHCSLLSQWTMVG